MLTVVGIDFTEHAAQNLRRRGFKCEEPLSFDSHRRFTFPLRSVDQRFVGFEIHIIDDERLYLRETQMQHFFPYVKNTDLRPLATQQENGVHTLTKVLSYGDLGETTLGHYLEIRKGFDIPALLLECESLEEFRRIAKPDMAFKFSDRPAELIHLGPSCFDLVIAQAGVSVDLG